MPQPEGPSSAKKLPFLERQRDVVDGRGVAEALGDRVEGEDGGRSHVRVTAPWPKRCENSTSAKLNSMTTVAMALISGVTPKRIIE